MKGPEFWKWIQAKKAEPVSVADIIEYVAQVAERAVVLTEAGPTPEGAIPFEIAVEIAQLSDCLMAAAQILDVLASTKLSVNDSILLDQARSLLAGMTQID